MSNFNQSLYRNSKTAIFSFLLTLSFLPCNSQTTLFSEGFENSYPPPQWSIQIYAPGGNGWNQYFWDKNSGNYSAACFPNVSNTNSWLFTGVQPMQAGKYYVLSYYIKTDANTSLKITLNTSPEFSGQYKTIRSSFPAPNGSFNFVTDTVVCEVSGNYYIGFNNFSSNTLSSSSLIDDIIFKEMSNYPNCTNITAGSISSVANICPGTPFSLSASGATLNTIGIRYAWQKSSDGTSWTNITNTYQYQTSIQAMQNGPTFYRMVDTCTASGNSAISNVILVGNTPFLNCYCIPTSISCFDFRITNITILNTSINNTTGCSAVGYANYSSLGSATVYRGQNIYLQHTVGNTFNFDYNVGIWVDLDHSGTFDQNEFSVTGFSNVATAISQFTIPATALTGDTRIRIRIKYAIASAGPLTYDEFCNTTGVAGEVEDYLLNIIDPPNCSGTVTAGTVSAPATVCPNNNFLISVANPTLYQGQMKYAWQKSADGTSWTNINNTSYLINPLRVSQTTSTFYRLTDTCLVSGQHSISNSLNVVCNNVFTCYCVPALSNCSSFYIDSVSFNTIHNGSACGTSGYSNYISTLNTTIDNGTNSNIYIRVKPATASTKYVSVYIDFNQNGLFESSEKVFNSVTTGTVVAGNINIPFNVIGGETLMRVVLSNSSFATSCNTVGTGEIEDYKIILNLASPVTNRFSYYVKKTATGANNGSNWANAFTSITSALAFAKTGDTIKVAKASYTPGTVNTNTFTLKDSLIILGGFPDVGNPTNTDRDFKTHQTVLTGEIGTATPNDNIRVILTAANIKGILIDGFIIEDGYDPANNTQGPVYFQNSSGTIANTVIRRNYNGLYGAALNAQNSAITLVNTIIEDNTSDSQGFTSSVLNINSNSNLKIVNTVIAKNRGKFIINQDNASLKLLNCTILKNYGFINVQNNSDLTVQNSILYYNGSNFTRDTAEISKDIYSTVNINNTITEVYNNTSLNYIGLNPKFIDTISVAGSDNKYFSDDDGLRLLNPCSPAINTGNNSFIASYNTDITGNVRIKNGVVDMGAYEVQEAITTQPSVLYVNRTATGLNDGSSWANAFTNLQSAFYRCSDTIKVAKGIYPVSATDPDAYYQLSNNRVVMGGFPNTGNPANSSFDPVANPTYIDGTVGGSNKSYTLVVAANNDSTSKFVGFELINSAQPNFNTNPNHATIKIIYKSSPFLESIKLDCAKNLASHLVMIDANSKPKFYKSAFYNLFSNQSSSSEIRSVTVTKSSAPIFLKCYFGKDTTTALSGNIVAGAVLSINGSGGLIDSCTFFKASNYAIYNINSSPLIQNTTFTKTRGRSITNNNSTLLIKNCVFNDSVFYLEENGNTIANLNNSNATYFKCRFNGSYSYYNGGVGFNDNSAASFNSCIFSNIYASNIAAGLYNKGSQVKLTNCIAYNFNNNSGSFSGMFLSNYENSNTILQGCTIIAPTTNQSSIISSYSNSSVKVYNSILWRYGSTFLPNTTQNDITTTNDNNVSVCDIRNSILYRQQNTLLVNSKVGVNPKLNNLSIANGSDNTPYTIDDGYKPCACSPAINAGDNSLNSVSTDILDANRIYGGTIDIGAYELQENRTTDNSFFVKETAASGGNGLSWSTAYNHLQKAILNNCADTIRIASGIYKPALAAKDSSFNIYMGQTILGGYPNTGNPVDADRNPILYPTILSGDIGIANDSTDNSSSVVFVHCPDTTVILDGLIIEKGNAPFGSSSNGNGGGILTAGTKYLTINNCIIRNNYALSGGGIASAYTNLTVNKSVITNNNAASGGGFYITDSYQLANGYPFRPAVRFKNSVLSNNMGTAGFVLGTGVGVALVDTMQFENMIFYKNEGPSGAGLHLSNNPYTKITNCTFVKNNLTSIGSSGVSVFVNNPFNLGELRTVVTNCIFKDNTILNQPANAINCDFNWSNGSSNYETIPFINLRYSAVNGCQTGTGWQNNVSAGNVSLRDINNAIGNDNIWMTADDGLQATTCSNSIDTGGNQFAQHIPKDILDSVRIKNNRVDLGAYETNSFTAKIIASDTAICPGVSVTFTATVENSGINPIYQWTLNGANVGTNSASYTNTTLANGDKIMVKVKTQDCATHDTAYSNIITMVVGNSINPVANITASDTTICSGNPVTFTAAATNSNAGSVYQWQVNNVNQGTNSNTFTTSSLSNNDQVKVIVTINAACLSTQTVTSNTILVHVNPVVIPSVSITSSANPVCPGTTIIFTATPINGGNDPAYQWKVNGVNTGSNSNIFSSSSIQNNDVITVVMTSSSTCSSPVSVTSNTIIQQVSTPLTPSVSVSASATNICLGTLVTFSATPTNGGNNPSYQWQVNGVNAGTNSNTFATSTLVNNDQVKVIMASNENCLTNGGATSNSIVMSVGSPTNPSVFINASSTTICFGGSVTFTAVPTNGGSNPSYQWQVNGVNTGVNSNSFTTNNLVNNDQVKVIMTSNAGCATSTTATSNTIIISVSSSVTPSVSINASATAICSGASVTFTSVPTNGGSNPSYQWQVNGVNAGTNSNTFTTTTLVHNDQVKVIMTSSLACANPASATSNTVIVSVSSSATPSVSINASATAICSGATVTFTAVPTNGGSSPSYQWQVNGVNTGTNNNTFTTTSLTNGAQVKVIMTSNASCLSTTTATSNTITMTVSSTVTPAVSIATSSTNTCTGASVTFTATPTNGGTNPSYQWQVNGINAGTNSNIFTTTSLTNGAQVKVIMTSNANCVSSSTATSNTITINVGNNNLIPVIIVSGNTTVNLGQSTILSSTATNGGLNPTYQWKDSTATHNWQNIISATAPTLIYSPLKTGDRVKCEMSSTASCLSSNNATSNILVFTVTDTTTGGRGVVNYYPNPVNSILYLDRLSLLDKWETAEVISIDGRLAIRPISIVNQTRVELNVSRLSSGQHIIILTNKDGVKKYLLFIKI